MRRWAKKLAGITLALAALTCFLVAPKANASVDDFDITSFDADYTLSNKDPQGELHVIERIKVDFTDNNHGIKRGIPSSYKKHSLQMVVNSVKSDTGAPTQYTTYNENGNTVIKIGAKDRTVTGVQEYTIDYTLRNVISFYGDHDELYWDINGDQSKRLTKEVSVTLHLPKELKLTSEKPLCYAGLYHLAAQDCTINSDENSHTISSSATRVLAPNETLTIVAGFQKGFFQPSKWYETVGESSRLILGFAIPFLLFVTPAAAYWFRRGRDPKGKKVIVPEYDAPDKLKAIEVGTIIDFTTDNKDITATIIDLAIRGYIQIIEKTKVRKLAPDKTTYALKLVKADKKGLDDNEKLLLDSIFSDGGAGKEVDLSELKFKLSGTATTLRSKIKDDLLERGYFQNHHITGKVLAVGAVVFVLWAAALAVALLKPDLLSWPAAIIATLVGAGVASVFLYLSRSRTLLGVATKERIQGLKLYLKTAEADRIKMLQSPKARYAAGAGSKEPAKTVQLFEKLLPYAMVLGVEEQWAKQFEDIYKAQPDWYAGGHYTTFNAIYLTSAISHGISTSVNATFSAPSSSSGSGMGGGGFSGGGGGGGGVGGW